MPTLLRALDHARWAGALATFARPVQMKHRESDSGRALHESRLRHKQLGSHAVLGLDPLEPAAIGCRPPDHVVGNAARVVEVSRVARAVVPGHEVLGTLGRGGMGIVYRAEHTLIGRTDASLPAVPYKSASSR